MKKVLFAFAMLFGVSLAANAQVTEQQQDTTGISRQSDQSDQYRTDDQRTDDQMDQTQQDPTLQDDQMNQGNQNQSRTQDQGRDQDRGEEISIAQLPATVSEKLQSQDYVGWTVEKAHRKQKDGETVYAVELRQGNETKKVKFDAQGNEMDDKDKKDKKSNDRNRDY